MSKSTTCPPLLPIAEAQKRLFALAAHVATETVPLNKAAGRWSATDVFARRTQPAAALSAMDGYAFRFDDMPGPWRVVGESAAGRPFAGTVHAGEAVRIFTGAALPSGADTVLVQEEARRELAPSDNTEGRLYLDGDGPAHRGRNTRPKGLDFTKGDRLIAAGERLTPARIALAATAGHGSLAVNRPIRVATLATGDELVPPGAAATGVELPESNTPMVAALLADLPIELIELGIVSDSLDDLVHIFSSLSADLLVTTGGASVGDHDLVRPALNAAGGTIDFWRTALRPGKPIMAGRLGNTMVLGLPGNPVSAFVTTLLFVKPLIAAMAGARDPLPHTYAAPLGEPIPVNGERTDYLRADLIAGRAWASTIQDSSMLLTLARAGCLIVRPPFAPAAAAGDVVEILPLA